MEFSMADLHAVGEVARSVDPNPFRLGARVLGLSSAEQGAGVPAWGWWSLGLGIGVVAGICLSQTDLLQKHLGTR